MELEKVENKFKYSIKTLGCKANLYDSLILESELQTLGGVKDDNAPNLFIVNSCTVTQGADKEVLYTLKNFKKNNPNAFTLVTGCAAQVAKELMQEKSFIDYVFTNEEKKDLKSFIAKKFNLNLSQDEILLDKTSNHIQDIYWGQLPPLQEKTRAFLKIQDGCNDYCTYCIIPYARGKSRSIPMAKILAEVERLAQSGVQEVVLTGINLADYGLDHGYSFDDLVEALIEHTSIKRIRLSSLDPSEISDRLISMMAKGSSLMPHFHISLQSASDRVLRAMKRHYRTTEIIKTLNKIYNFRNDIYVGMDVIAGFPSETIEEHKETLELLKNLPWTRLHVFPYSERQNTPALKIKPSVPISDRKIRAHELMQLSHERQKQFVQTYVNQAIDGVLFESVQEVAGDFYCVGHAENYLRVMSRVPTRSKQDALNYINKIASSKILQCVPKPEQDWTLEGYFHQSYA